MTNQIEFWILVSGFVITGIGWIVKTYTTFAKQSELEALNQSMDNRFSAVQDRINKTLDELKREIRSQGESDIEKVKEVHNRIDRMAEKNQTILLRIGELKGRLDKD
jgi:DNA anti-recombination protein RmuC